MESVLVVLILLAAVVVSEAITRLIPVPVPTPLIQIVVGAGLSFILPLGVTLQPQMFFLLFIAPLLFLDGWRIPKEGLYRDRWTVLQLALGLVVFTVLGVGYFIYWIIPAMPLAVAFALAAIISPTDPISVSAITKRVPMPKRLLHILEGESLLNDASGLVSMGFAVNAALYGVFSLTDAFGTFLWTSIVGLIIGAAMTYIVTWLLDLWTHKLGEETGVQIIVSLLLPFMAYLLAEELYASGILAAVSAGITMSFSEDGLRRLASTRMRRVAVWDTVQFVANGIIFVLLGAQIPQIVSGAAVAVRETGHYDPLWLIVYVLAINFSLALLRFIWVWVSLRFTLARANKRGLKPYMPDWRLITVTTLSGVRGTVTLAGVMTLPLFLPSGDPFPVRQLAIFLAAGVIVFSLIAASVALPYLLKNVTFPPEPSHQKEEDRARVNAAEAAIKAVESAVHELGEGRADADLYTIAATRVMETYRSRLEGLSGNDEEMKAAHKIDEIEKQLYLKALKAERQVYVNLGRRHQVSEEALNRFINETDLIETRLSNKA